MQLTFPFARIHVNISVDKFVETNQQLVSLDDKTIDARSTNGLKRIRQTSHDTFTTEITNHSQLSSGFNNVRQQL